VVAELATWGYAWAWGPPRPGEAVDIGAIVRAASGHAAPRTGRTGTAELIVSTRGRADRHYALTLSRDGMTIEERSAPDADARVSGAEGAWIDAFSPTASRRGLTIEGDAGVADAVLELCGAPVAESSDASAVA
jgi:hypothetical protein